MNEIYFILALVFILSYPIWLETVCFALGIVAEWMFDRKIHGLLITSLLFPILHLPCLGGLKFEYTRPDELSTLVMVFVACLMFIVSFVIGAAVMSRFVPGEKIQLSYTVLSILVLAPVIGANLFFPDYELLSGKMLQLIILTCSSLCGAIFIWIAEGAYKGPEEKKNETV